MSDPISPDHYQQYPGVEVIDLTRHMDFLRGNVVKYVARAGHKGDELEDLRRAQQYLTWAIEDAEKRRIAEQDAIVAKAVGTTNPAARRNDEFIRLNDWREE